MKRWLAICVALATFAGVAVLGGCGTPQPSPSTSPSVTSSASGGLTVSDPSPGMQDLNGFVTATATTFSDGVVGVGDLPQGQVPLPALLRSTGGTSWTTDAIGTKYRLAQGAAESGTTRVVVGVNHDRPSGGQGESFAAVSTNGSPWSIDNLVVVTSTELRGIAAVGDGNGGTQFMAVGAHANSKSGQVGDPSATLPVAIFSSDGKTWKTTAPMPLPDKAAGGEAWSVVEAGSNAAFQGTIVVGIGWVADKALGARVIGIVWQSTDGGRSWKIVSDSNFDEVGRDMQPRYVAADDSTIVVGGMADVPGQTPSAGTDLQTESVEWTAGTDGQWRIFSDGKSLEAGRSSRDTAITDRAGGGFLVASMLYQTDTGPYKSGSQQAVQILASPDGATWNNVTASIPDIDKSSQIMGVAEFNDLDVLMGADQSQGFAAWVVDAATLK